MSLGRSPSNPSSPKKAGSKSPLRKTSPSPRRGPKGTAVSQASSLMATPVSPKRSKSPVKSASLAKSPVAVKSLSSASARQTKPTPSNVDHYYYLAYVSVFFSAYLYLFYIMEKKFCIDNVLKVWQSGKALSMLCEEAFYRSILTTFKGYLEILLQPFLLVSTLNAFFETAHHFFGCNKSFKQRVSSVGETYFPFITNILLYVMFISCPVKATSSHPLVFTLLSTMIIEKFIVFLHRLLTISLDTVPKSVHYLRYSFIFP